MEWGCHSIVEEEGRDSLLQWKLLQVSQWGSLARCSIFSQQLETLLANETAVCLSLRLPGALTPLALAGLFGEKASTKSEDKKLSSSPTCNLV